MERDELGNFIYPDIEANIWKNVIFNINSIVNTFLLIKTK